MRTAVMEARPRRTGRHGPLAARDIPGARLERLQGEDHFLGYGGSQAVVTAIERFVAEHAGHGSTRQAQAA